MWQPTLPIDCDGFRSPGRAPYSHSIINEASKLLIRLGLCIATQVLTSLLPSVCEASALARVSGAFDQS